MKKILITLIAITFSSVLFAQNSYFRARASREFNRLNYSEAITYYEHLLKDGGAEINDLKNLATAYLKVNDPKDAERILKMVIEQDPDEPLFVKKYALVLETNTKYKEAIEQWKKYVTLAPDDKMAQNHLDFLANTCIVFGYSYRVGEYQSPIAIALCLDTAWVSQPPFLNCPKRGYSP